MTHAEKLMEEERLAMEVKDEIQGMFPEIDFPNTVLEPIYFGRLTRTEVVGKKLVLDRKNGVQFDVVSDMYKLHHHEQMIKNLIEAIPVEFGKPEISVNMHRDGAVCSISANFPELGEFKVNNSPIQPFVRMTNSYDRTRRLLYDFGAKELICTNGLVAYKTQANGSVRHIEGSMSKMAIHKELKASIADFSENRKVWDHWVQNKIDREAVQLFLDTKIEKDFSENERETILQIPLINNGNLSLNDLLDQRKATVWNLNSALTQFARHNMNELRGEKTERIIAAKMMYNFWR